MFQRNTRSVWTNLGIISLALAVILLIRNISSVFNTPGWDTVGFFTVFFDTNFVGMPSWLSYLMVWGPFPLIILGVVFLVIGRGKDKEKAAAAAEAQQQAFNQPYGQPGAPVQPGQQPYGQAPAAQPYGQAPAPAAQPGQAQAPAAGEQAPGQQQGNPPYGQVPPLS